MPTNLLNNLVQDCFLKSLHQCACGSQATHDCPHQWWVQRSYKEHIKNSNTGTFKTGNITVRYNTLSPLFSYANLSAYFTFVLDIS